MYDVARGQHALIIPCGGPTNCAPPYEGTEAAAIGGYIQGLIGRSIMGEWCKEWRVVLEDASFSTLENLVFAKRLVDATKRGDRVTIFCEATRKERVEHVALAVFGPSFHVSVEAIDFDISPNRYLDPVVLEQKEHGELQGSLWALESPEHFAKHHELFERKFALLKSLQDGGMSHADAVSEWYRLAPAMMAECIPEYPALHTHQKAS